MRLQRRHLRTESCSRRSRGPGHSSRCLYSWLSAYAEHAAELGQAWQDQAARETSRVANSAMLRHAALWYRTALEGVDDDRRSDVERRLAQTSPITHTPSDDKAGTLAVIDIPFVFVTLLPSAFVTTTSQLPGDLSRPLNAQTIFVADSTATFIPFISLNPLLSSFTVANAW